MYTHSSIPWSRINDYVAELGSVANLDEFGRRALKSIDRLIPFDANGMFVNTDKFGKVRSWITTADSEKWLTPFNSYFYLTMPDVEGKDIITLDWNKYHNKEYATDFIKPQGLRYTVGVFRFGVNVNQTAVLTVHRSKSSHHFDETEQLICNLLQPHLTNIFTMLFKLNLNNHGHIFSAELIKDCKLLSKREAEIAILLCQRLTAPEIATKLMISRRTVEFHIANIYTKLKARNRQEFLVRIMGWK